MRLLDLTRDFLHSLDELLRDGEGLGDRLGDEAGLRQLAQSEADHAQAEADSRRDEDLLDQHDHLLAGLLDLAGELLEAAGQVLRVLLGLAEVAVIAGPLAVPVLDEVADGLAVVVRLHTGDRLVELGMDLVDAPREFPPEGRALPELAFVGRRPPDAEGLDLLGARGGWPRRLRRIGQRDRRRRR